MKSLVISFILLGIISAFPAHALQSDEKSDGSLLDNVDAIQAIAIANQWKWSKKEIKSTQRKCPNCEQLNKWDAILCVACG